MIFRKGIPCFLRSLLCNCSRVWTCQRWLTRTIINARRYRFQNYGATSGPREINPGCCRDVRSSYTRRRRLRMIHTPGSISAPSATSPSRRATRCIGITDTSAIRCRVISAPIVATSASGPTRSTIISGRSIRDRRSCWTSSTSQFERAVVRVIAAIELICQLIWESTRRIFCKKKKKKKQKTYYYASFVALWLTRVRYAI